MLSRCDRITGFGVAQSLHPQLYVVLGPSAECALRSKSRILPAKAVKLGISKVT